MSSSDNSLSRALSLLESFTIACKAAGPIAIRATHRTTGVQNEHSINSPFAFLGRSSMASVRLDDPSVSNFHAYLQVIDGNLFCIDLGSRTGVVWDDGTRRRGWVRPENTLRIGAFDVSVGDQNGRPGFNLADENEIRNGCESGLWPAAVEIHSTETTPAGFHPLDHAITLIGRHPACELRLLDSSVGYFQCALVNTAEGVWSVDFNNQHGTLVNGRGTRLARLRDGDLLEFGKVTLLLMVGPHHESRIARRAPAPLVAVTDPAVVISTKVAESVASAITPVADMMKQFQDCFTTMAQMFASMQQEHAALVSEQIRQIQELASEVRELRAARPQEKSLPAASVQPPAPTAPTAPLPPPSAVPLENSQGSTFGALSRNATTRTADAHAWFMERLANKGLAAPEESS